MADPKGLLPHARKKNNDISLVKTNEDCKVYQRPFELLDKQQTHQSVIVLEEAK
jgi:hypothetical protein